MKISYNTNKVEEIKNIIQAKAKYQKVMIVFDESVSNLEIGEIYNSIKEFCIYNQCPINQIDKQELSNGYRLIVFLCEVDNFLEIDFSLEEYINIFCPQDAAILPYFLNQNNNISLAENYLILDAFKVDIELMCCVYFNQFFNYFNNLLSLKNRSFEAEWFSQDITAFNMIKILESVDGENVFLDIDIIKKYHISYNEIMLVDLLLIDAFLLLIMSIKSQSLSLVDVYKAAKEDNGLIDKFYACSNNDAFFNLVLLNYNCLYNFCVKTKQKIIDCFNVGDVREEQVKIVMKKIKEYAKNDCGICGYLYLFNLFGV